MAKDPAFLFYSQDFLVGTMAMPFEERGRYITILCYMHQNGRLNEETIKLLVGSFSDMLRAKFIQDENGLFYNKRLEIEAEKRTKFVESRQMNGLKGGRPVDNKALKKNNLNKTDRLGVGKPTDNLIENENVIENVISYLNKKVSSEFKITTRNSISLIKGLLKNGYTEEHLLKVIDIKSEKWLGTEWESYLRPTTLFGPKFESYLNEKPKVNELLNGKLRPVH